MNEQVIIFRPASWERDLKDLPITAPVFVRDGRAFLELKDDELAKSVAAIDAKLGFLEYPDLIDLLRKVTGRKESREAASFIWNLHRIWRHSGKSLQAFIDESQAALRDPAVDSDEGLTADEREQLAQRLPRAMTDARSLYLQWRADSVSEATGLKLEDARLFCDARPVFNEDRGAIEGMVVLTTLKVQATDLNGLATALEVRLSPKQLRALVKTVTEGETKLKTMAAFMTDKGISFSPVDRGDVELS
jgi:hypothetical protein